jgi:hypothetical protein
MDDQFESYQEEQERAIEREFRAEAEEMRYHKQRTKRPADRRRAETEWEAELGGEA